MKREKVETWKKLKLEKVETWKAWKIKCKIKHQRKTSNIK